MNPTPEQVAQWAREAGAYQYGGSAPDRIFTFYSFSQIIQFVALAMAEQAEKDAKVCDEKSDASNLIYAGAAAAHCAAAIRANAPKVTT